MAWLFILSFCVLAYALWTAYVLFENYQKARQIGLPIIFSPFNVLNPIWALFHKQLIPIIRRIPWAKNSVNYTYVGWPYDDKYAIHERLGPAFVVVNPLRAELYIADGEAIDDICSRRKDFPKVCRPVSGLQHIEYDDR